MSSSSANASLKNPGVMKSAPASTSNTPSSTGATGGRPCASACCDRRTTLIPWWATIMVPRSPAPTTNPSVGPDTDGLPGLDEQRQLDHGQRDQN